MVNRVANLDLNRIVLNHGPLATDFEHLARRNTAKSRAMLVEAGRVAEARGLDDTLLGRLVVGLGLE
jgi:hypothetical protein